MKSRIAFYALISIMLLSVTKSGLACKGSQVLFQDYFVTLDPSWGESKDKQSVKDGKLTIQPAVNQVTVYINGTEDLTFNGQSPQSGGLTGMLSYTPEKARNKNVWEFSDLKVTK